MWGGSCTGGENLVNTEHASCNAQGRNLGLNRILQSAIVKEESKSQSTLPASFVVTLCPSLPRFSLMESTAYNRNLRNPSVYVETLLGKSNTLNLLIYFLYFITLLKNHAQRIEIIKYMKSLKNLSSAHLLIEKLGNDFK